MRRALTNNSNKKIFKHLGRESGKRFNIVIKRGIWEELEREVKKTRRSRSYILNEALLHYFYGQKECMEFLLRHKSLSLMQYVDDSLNQGLKK